MDSKDFAEYLKSTLNTSLSTWNNSILTGTLSKDIPYERAVGIRTAIENLSSSLDTLYENFKKKVSGGGDL